MQLNLQQEQYGNAYITALAAVAGFAMNKPTVDDDSIDWVIAARGPYKTFVSPKIEVQLKCPYGFTADEATIGYSISMKNYNDLRNPRVMVPRVLIVVCIPAAIEEWIGYHDEGLTLKRCAYWKSLVNEPDVTNKTEITVRLPKSQRLTVESLQLLMDRAGAGELL